jgi:hypothetical protein
MQCIPIWFYQGSLFETFNDAPSGDKSWNLIQGGKLGVGCSPLVDGKELVFSGQGRRQAITRDLDLRNAKYVI